MLLLIERLAGVYSGEGAKICVSFDELIVHSKPEVIKGNDIRRALASILKRYLTTTTACKLVENLGAKVGDYTLTRDEKDDSYTLITDVDLSINMVTDAGTTTTTAVIPAILFQLYQIN